MAARRAKKANGKVKRHKPEPVMDDIFFHVSQLKPGVRLIGWGRLDPLSQWEAIDIRTHQLGKKVGEVRQNVKTAQARFLSDKVTIRNLKTNETKTLKFSGMSYSAIWRLAP